MKLKKAVITAAGPNQNRLPLQRFVDLDGQQETALQIIVEEVVAAGVDQIAVVVQPGDPSAYAEAAGGSRIAAGDWPEWTVTCGCSKAWPCRAKRKNSSSPTTIR